MLRRGFREALGLGAVAVSALAAGGVGLAGAGTASGLVCANSAGTLSVASSEGARLVASVRRRGPEPGAEIVVGFGSEVACSGPPPTVDNVDRIEIRGGDRRRDTVFVDLVPGPLAPGFSDEGDGSSEIEIDVDLGGDQGDGVELTTPEGQRDVVRVGRRGRRHLVNPNAARERGGADSDLTLRGVKRLGVFSRDGRDTISGRGAPGGSKPARIALGFGTSGRGADRLIGGNGADGLLTTRNFATDDLLKGGRGRDSLDAVAGDDKLVGGPGRDELKGGGGRDAIQARDGSRDRVDCGGGVDRGRGDAGDRLRRCERLRLR